MAGWVLTNQQIDENMAILSDSQIVRIISAFCTAWNALSAGFNWAEQNYDHIFKLCLALKKFHTRLHPLRETDELLYRQALDRLSHISHDAPEKRRPAQQHYSERHRRRLDAEKHTLRRSGTDAYCESDEGHFSAVVLHRLHFIHVIRKALYKY